MATSSFLNRWSKRKLEQASGSHSAEPQTHEPELLREESDVQPLPVEDESQTIDTETDLPSEEQNTEKPSIANLLVSEASESVKKAALRKLFLSEEFNVRDGLDDYDDDYSNLKSLSEGVADTLRDWIKDKTEEDQVQEQQNVKAEDEPVSKSLTDSEQVDEENLKPDELNKDTVVIDESNSEVSTVLEQIGQNRPDQK